MIPCIHAIPSLCVAYSHHGHGGNDEKQHPHDSEGGPYARIRHPQYMAFVLIMLGFLVQWPTLLTLAMFPVLVWMYTRLARHEEAEMRQAFGAEYAHYFAATPAFFPCWRSVFPRENQ